MPERGLRVGREPRGRRVSVTVAVGVFDGLHLGHRSLFDRALARAAGGRCVAVSFDPHPDVVLASEFHARPPLTPLPEKHDWLAAIGIELHVLPFTRELAALSPESFVEEHLVRPYHPHWLVVGIDFALGRGRAGNVARLGEIGEAAGFAVEAVPLLMLDGGPVTSTRVREALARGEVETVSRLLGRPYEFSGLVVHGQKLGRRLGFPTANLRLHHERQTPAYGVYAVWARIQPDGPWLPGALSYGERPTFDGLGRAFEVHLLEGGADLYGRDLAVRIVARVREERAFPTSADLVARMHEDVRQCRELLAARVPGDATPS